VRYRIRAFLLLEEILLGISFPCIGINNTYSWKPQQGNGSPNAWPVVYAENQAYETSLHDVKFLSQTPSTYTEGLKNNTDGSLDIYIQHVSPGRDRESNWLPSDKNSFNLILRMYLPAEVLNGTWAPPLIRPH
jgi:hypothetical protein